MRLAETNADFLDEFANRPPVLFIKSPYLLEQVRIELNL
jgi:hypothetical protein